MSPNASVQLHPVVLFSICDGYVRRSEKQDRVIGTLLGTVSSDGVVEIKNCYIVPHNESAEQIAVDIAHHKTMFELHQKVAPSEIIVGWFSTGPALFTNPYDAIIQEIYSKEAPNSVLLMVDTTLQGGKFATKAFTSRLLTLRGEKTLATEFVEMPCEVLFGEAERVGIDLLSGGASTKPLSDNGGLATSLKRLEELLNKVYSYVDDVAEGRIKGDPAIGRYLADTLSVVPHFSKPEFERLFNESVTDVMMVSYLSNLLRTQIALAEKLGTGQLPLL